MSKESINIFVFADWFNTDKPKLIGTLSAQNIRGKYAFSFEYDDDFLKFENRIVLDPNLTFFSGQQFAETNRNFGLFLDSMPDTWGRTLLQRKEIMEAKKKNKKPRNLSEIDYLLGVFDTTRSGALRFKLDLDGPFLNDKNDFPIPPWSSARELQYAVDVLESSNKEKEINKWLNLLLAPGSSLGGARPKANIVDQYNNLWIAKFPSKNDTTNKGAWEFVAYKLALSSKIEMAESLIQKLIGHHATFFTKRFDRRQDKRIHFASAMTMTGYDESKIKDKAPSYLEIAEFIQNHSIKIKSDLHQLWRRIIFNILISNTDDHLRNHGFIVVQEGWTLSPAFDINPSIDKEGLALNIDMHSNDLDIELAKSVGVFFRLNNREMNKIVAEVKSAVKEWRKEAEEVGIPKREQLLMQPAFRV